MNKKYDTLDGVVAHASSKACVKVYEAASQFEPMLQFEMLPKSEIWPKSFQKAEPSEKNIALYFFPSKIRYQFLIITIYFFVLSYKFLCSHLTLIFPNFPWK